ncbi:MAG: hypothetical protein ACREV1_01660 [Gammaproteobacteria bacterium]
MKVRKVVFFAKEAWLAVVTALHDVQGYSIKLNTRVAGHKPNIIKKSNLSPIVIPPCRARAQELPVNIGDRDTWVVKSH